MRLNTARLAAMSIAIAGSTLTAVAGCSNPVNKVSYAGDWAGVTAHGEPIAFTVSAGEAVTSLTIGHSFNGCRASQTFSNLNLSIKPNIVCVPGPCSDSISSSRSFSFQQGTLSQDLSQKCTAVSSWARPPKARRTSAIFPGAAARST